MPHYLFHGDCLEVMKTLDANSVDSLVTDPPAGIAFMGKEWDKDKGGTMQDDAYRWKLDGKGNPINLDTRQANHHPTVKSTQLMTYLIRMVTPPGSIVLDPFMGSGSTGVAAVKEGLDFIGIEQSSEYLEIAHKRIDSAYPSVVQSVA